MLDPYEEIKGENPMTKSPKTEYGVRGTAPENGSRFIVWEYVNGFPVNEYTGYDCKTYLVLYPRRRLIPSTTEMTKRKVDLMKTRREF